MAECPQRFEFVKPANRVTTHGKTPAGRSGHCCASDEANIYIYGGYNPKTGPLMPDGASIFTWFKRQVMAEVWKFNYATKMWRKITKKSDHTHKTAASACCAMLPGQTPSMLVYGGTVVPWGQKVSNKLSLCHLQDGEYFRGGQWQEVPVTSRSRGGMPPPGYGQSMVVHQGYVYVFTGAVAYTGDPVSELHRLELRTGTWQAIEATGTPPTGRYKQEMVLYNDRFILIIGGGHEWESASLQQIYVFDTEQNTWSTWACHQDLTHGFPRSRASFGCELLGNCIYIFGGRHYTKQSGEWALNSCWRLDLEQKAWERLNITLPIDVYFHTSCLSPAGYVYLFGGISDNQKRINHLYRLRVFVPRLSEFAWERITNCIKNLSKKHMPLLRQAGVPENFIHRLS